VTPTVKSGIAPANFAMTDWESFDVRFGSFATEASGPNAGPMFAVAPIATKREVG
jgi:hypothetical protein